MFLSLVMILSFCLNTNLMSVRAAPDNDNSIQTDDDKLNNVSQLRERNMATLLQSDANIDTFNLSRAGGLMPVGTMQYVNNLRLDDAPHVRLFDRKSKMTYSWSDTVKLSKIDVPYPWSGERYDKYAVNGRYITNIWVSTHSDNRFHGGEWIKVRYKKAGMYANDYIDVEMTFHFGDSRNIANSVNYCGSRKSLLRLGANHSYWGDMSYANLLDGYVWYNSSQCRVDYAFYYSDRPNELVPLTDLYVKAGSLNPTEGFSVYENTQMLYTNKQVGAYPNLYEIHTGDVVPDMGNYHDTANVWEPEYSPYWVINVTSDNFYDDILYMGDDESKNTFWKSCAGMYVRDEDHIFNFRYYTHSAWFAPNLTPLGATADKPSKSILDGGENKTSVKKNYGETVTFEIEQPVQIYGYVGTGYLKYSNFSFTDVLPDGLDYVSAKVVCRVNGSDTDVTGNGTLRYNASNRTVSFAFDTSYLSNGMAYVGESYVLQINAIVHKHGVVNTAYTTICNTRQDTNEVEVLMPYTVHYDNNSSSNPSITQF